MSKSDLSYYIIFKYETQFISFNFRKDEVCLAIYEEDGNWYRAVCLYGDIEKKEFMLHFIDFGNLQIVHKSKIIPVNKEFAELEILANKVFLDGKF